MAQDRIRKHVEADSSKYLDVLKEACSIPSVSAEGQGLEEMASWLESRLKRLGAEVTRLKVGTSADALLGVIPSSGDRTLMIYDHYDVQPVDPIELWESPPFAPAERDGHLYARGAADNKGDLCARLCALEAYRELFGDLPFTIKFFVEGEEESASENFEEICRTYAGQLVADDCVWEGGWFDHQGRPTMYFGCKGLLYVELWSKKLSGDQHSAQAALAPSAVWELTKALSSIKDDDGRIVIDGFFEGIVQPGTEELEMLDRIAFDEEAEKKRLGIDSFIGGVTGLEAKRQLLYEPTANIAGFLSGYTIPGASKTVLPEKAMAKMDFRLVPDQHPEDVADKLRRHLSKHGFDEVDVVVLGAEHPSRSPLDTHLGTVTRDVAARWFDKPANVYPWMAATGPMYPIAQGLGIPICSPPGVGGPYSRIHAPNENANIADYLEIVGYTVSYLERYGAS